MAKSVEYFYSKYGNKPRNPQDEDERFTLVENNGGYSIYEFRSEQLYLLEEESLEGCLQAARRVILPNVFHSFSVDFDVIDVVDEHYRNNDKTFWCEGILVGFNEDYLLSHLEEDEQYGYYFVPDVVDGGWHGKKD